MRTSAIARLIACIVRLVAPVTMAFGLLLVGVLARIEVFARVEVLVLVIELVRLVARVRFLRASCFVELVEVVILHEVHGQRLRAQRHGLATNVV